MRSQKVDQRAARVIHRTMILNELRRCGPLSRTQLAERTQLSPAAVSFVTADLLTEALLVEQAQHTSRGRAVPLDVNYAGHFAVGLKVMETHLEAVLTDLSLSVLGDLTVTYSDHTPQRVTAAAVEATNLLLAQAGLSRARLGGVGLGLPGNIDPHTGTCLKSYRLDWTEVPITGLISDALGVPVWADNDVNAFATAERLVGRGKHARDFLVVTVGRGIGSGLVLGGELYRGGRGGAGELGHLLSEPGGRVCECGKRGCLEAYAAEPSLAQQLAESGADVPNAVDFAALVADGDPGALTLVTDAGTRLGRALAQAANWLDPELIIVGGEGVRLGEPLFAPMRAALYAHLHTADAQTLPLLIDPWGDDAWARGAAGLVVEQFFGESSPSPPAEAAAT
ncbi:ROK family transcriptional regulator [Deinococcus sp. HMF7604]|uniref:ROK family transcriptional regulator n=1 Tax=Deinococcus betulae TaxID=2873312 RepID=UPI001CCB7401|nr:ROK family transcriptional regulator [Deinococcus betulae]MBZ9751524.1 ROK family transcriptional regulator [Deinococcus betulae]